MFGFSKKKAPVECPKLTPYEHWQRNKFNFDRVEGLDESSKTFLKYTLSEIEKDLITNALFSDSFTEIQESTIKDSDKKPDKQLNQKDDKIQDIIKNYVTLPQSLQSQSPQSQSLQSLQSQSPQSPESLIKDKLKDTILLRYLEHMVDRGNYEFSNVLRILSFLMCIVVMKRDPEWNIFLEDIKYLSENPPEKMSGGKRNHKTKRCKKGYKNMKSRSRK